jgi:hypothetical protein
MLTAHIALVSQTPAAPAESVMGVAAAVQRQVVRDFAPIWGVGATVEPFARLEQVPTGYWPIVIRDDLKDPGVVGLHLDDHGQPLALVQASNVLSLTVSHEALEMLADPYGNRLIPGGSLKQGQGVVEYLVEVADPVASIASAYSVNGVLVSDFVTPEYFTHPVPVAGAAYSFRGTVQRPRDVVDGGYVTWREPLTAHWWQAQLVATGQLQFSDLGVIQGAELGLRRLVDSLHMPRELIVGVRPDNPYLIAARERATSERAASIARAAAVNTLIYSLVPGGGQSGRPRGLMTPAPTGSTQPTGSTGDDDQDRSKKPRRRR